MWCTPLKLVDRQRVEELMCDDNGGGSRRDLCFVVVPKHLVCGVIVAIMGGMKTQCILCATSPQMDCVLYKRHCSCLISTL